MVHHWFELRSHHHDKSEVYLPDLLKDVERSEEKKKKEKERMKEGFEFSGVG